MQRGYLWTLSVVALFSWSTANGLSAEEAYSVCRYCEHATASAAASAGNGTKNYAPDRSVDVLHIKLDVTPDFASRTIAATATLEFSPIVKPVDELRLDAIGLHVNAVRSSSSVADYSVSDEDITVLFDTPIAAGSEAWIEIDYEIEPTKGLYFRTPEMGYPESDTHLWTQGEPHEARHWFPCFDYPNERSSTEVICHVPPEMTVLSNGKKLDEKTAGEIKTVHWRQDKPHANYLICLVAGHLEKLEKSHRDIPLAFFTQPTLAEHAENSFADTPDIMAFFEQEIGVDFPWDKYYQVTIRDFMWGGMENTSLTTLTHRTIFAGETENIHSTRGLDAHEMAHQWFGDYVTCKDWSHLWLNEGFATFYTHLFHEHKSGRDRYLYGLHRDAENRILKETKDKRPIVYKGYSSPSEQFDYRCYPKGAWVLHMLRSQLGPELYRKCIRTYLERHALCAVVTADLARVVEEVSGQSFDQFFDQWVYHPRFPDLNVTYHWDARKKLAHVSVEQTHEVNDAVRLFEFPTKIRFVIDTQIVDEEIEISDKRHDFYFALDDEPRIVRFDPDYSVLARVTFRKQPTMLLAQLENEDDVIGRLLAIQDLSKGKPKRSAVTALGATLNTDPFWGVRLAAAKALRKLDTDASYDALVAGLEQDDARVREAVVKELGHYYRPETLETLTELYANEANPAIRGAIVSSLGKFDHKATQRIVKRALASDTFRHEELAAAIGAVRDQRNKALLKTLQQTLAERGDELSSYTVARGLSALAECSRQGKKKEDIREFISGYLHHPKSTVRVAAVNALGKLGDPKSEPVLSSLAADRDDRLAKAAKEAVKKLQEEAPLVPAEVAEMRRALSKLRQDYEQMKEELDMLKLSSEASASDDQDLSPDEVPLTEGERAKDRNRRRKKPKDSVAEATPT